MSKPRPFGDVGAGPVWIDLVDGAIAFCEYIYENVAKQEDKSRAYWTEEGNYLAEKYPEHYMLWRTRRLVINGQRSESHESE